MRYLVLHVGAHARYAATGGMSVDQGPTSALLVGVSKRRDGAAKRALDYWVSSDSDLGSMTEHLVIIDTKIKPKKARKLSGWDKPHDWVEANILDDKMMNRLVKRAKRLGHDVY